MTSKRSPLEHHVMLYGGPPAPWPGDQPWIPDVTQPPIVPLPFVPLPNTTGTKIMLPEEKVRDPKDVDWKAVEKALKEAKEAAAYERVKTNVRVVTRKEADGTIKLKIYIDGELKTEVESDGTTLCSEFDL